jgi:hypothetical protein
MNELDDKILAYLRSLPTLQQPPTAVGLVAMFYPQYKQAQVWDSLRCMVRNGSIISRFEPCGGDLVEVIEAAPVPVAVAEGETP